MKLRNIALALTAAALVTISASQLIPALSPTTVAAQDGPIPTCDPKDPNCTVGQPGPHRHVATTKKHR